jgi:hypothetical protein
VYERIAKVHLLVQDVCAGLQKRRSAYRTVRGLNQNQKLGFKPKVSHAKARSEVRELVAALDLLCSRRVPNPPTAREFSG